MDGKFVQLRQKDNIFDVEFWIYTNYNGHTSQVTPSTFLSEINKSNQIN